MASIRLFKTATWRMRAVSLLALAVLVGTGLHAQWPVPLTLQVRSSGSYLGVRMVEIDEERAKTLKLTEPGGVEIAGVEDGAPADQAGLRSGDVILSYNGEKVLGAQHFVRLVGETPPGRHVRLVCWRADAQKELVVITGPPHTPMSIEDLDFPRLRVIDVPSPMMVWRNLVLGVDSQVLNEQLAQAFGVKQGILVWSVTPSYPAQRAGLKAGDVVTAFCGHAIRSPRELGIIMQQASNGQKAISVELVRDHKVISLSISLDNDR